MALQRIDNNATLEPVALTPAQRALLITLRRVLISAVKLIDSLIGK